MIPVIFIPGMMCDARLFGPQIDALSSQFAIINAPIHQRTTIKDIAKDILMTAPPQFAVAGLSLGGIVAMELMRLAPKRLLGAALIDTNPLKEVPAIQKRRLRQIADVKNGHLHQIMKDEMKPNYLAKTSDHATILNLCMQMAMDLGPQTFINQSMALRTRKDQTHTLAAFHRPALVMCGQQDTLCPPERHRFMHAIMPHSTLTCIKNAGHLPTLEAADETTNALSAWLQTL